ncbi:MAG TPA: response regulator [Ktedonobacteraceae bacterium]|nr:response regulator [Ktedonobacteraceae bacterium]
MPEYQNKNTENTHYTTKIILLVEDDAAIAELLVQMILQETPHHVFAVPDGPQALDIIGNVKPNLLILDYWLPTTYGTDLYDRLCAVEGEEQIPALMLSVNAPLEEIRKRRMAFMKKPFDVDKLLEAIQTLLV